MEILAIQVPQEVTGIQAKGIQAIFRVIPLLQAVQVIEKISKNVRRTPVAVDAVSLVTGITMESVIQQMWPEN